MQLSSMWPSSVNASFLSDVPVFLRVMLCLYVSLTSESSHKKLKPRTVQLYFLFWLLQKFPMIKKKKNRAIRSLWTSNPAFHFPGIFSPPILEKVTLGNLPLDGALILISWGLTLQKEPTGIVLSSYPMFFSSARQHTHTIKHKLIK